MPWRISSITGLGLSTRWCARMSAWSFRLARRECICICLRGALTAAGSTGWAVWIPRSEPGAAAGPIYSSPGSESFLYVLEGVARVDLAEGTVLTLNPGDSASYPAEEFVGMSNPHHSRLLFLWVQSGSRSSLTC